MLKREEKEHDCIESLRKRFELMESHVRLIYDKLQINSIEEHGRRKIIRQEVELPSMKTMLFRPDFYSTSSPDLHF